MKSYRRIMVMVVCIVLASILAACGGDSQSAEGGSGASSAMAAIPESAARVGEGDYADIEVKADYKSGFGDKVRANVTLITEREEPLSGKVYIKFNGADGEPLAVEEKSFQGLKKGKQVDLVCWPAGEVSEEAPEVYIVKP